ncbi:hypothetical protein K435DRAFT_854082 [Dendrothele bispora CBS 962.96]|uniref:Zn(2)-C6 fungal-type domain-containing protein n=1 Tax=Dendrothele bispora (strain CBS 962.96) TaxID=1314807 RepID=A0A4S8MEU0_DENBC|nr:hypothetical protein K435DRAFT_854082 [Dendrothele bispora CBS 962.96]
MSSQGSSASQNPDGPRVPKRTAMACTFCRGRKLKCDGMRPSCGNCDRRGYPCSYVPVSADKK